MSTQPEKKRKKVKLEEQEQQKLPDMQEEKELIEDCVPEELRRNISKFLITKKFNYFKPFVKNYICFEIGRKEPVRNHDYDQLVWRIFYFFDSKKEQFIIGKQYFEQGYNLDKNTSLEVKEYILKDEKK